MPKISEPEDVMSQILRKWEEVVEQEKAKQPLMFSVPNQYNPPPDLQQDTFPDFENTLLVNVVVDFETSELSLEQLGPKKHQIDRPPSNFIVLISPSKHKQRTRSIDDSYTSKKAKIS